MLLNDAFKIINDIAYIPFNELFSKSELLDIIDAKGKTGQILETLLGLKNSNKLTDFKDGELKTNKCNYLGLPLETIFITQINSIIDELVNNPPTNFYKSNLYKKIKNLLYVPVCKDGEPSNWFFHIPIHIDLNLPIYNNILNQLEKDYYHICSEINELILKNNSDLKTINGKFIQIRTKDSKPYTPIFSNIANRYVSDKNYAFYFKKEFIKDIITKI